MLSLNFIPVPQDYKSKEGFNFATKLAERAQAISLILTIAGWLLITFGILLGVAGSVLGTEAITMEDDAWERLFSQRGLICNTLAIIIAGVGRQLLGRAKASANLASIATKSIARSSKEHIVEEQASDEHVLDSDRVAYDACVMAKAVWLEGRVDDSQLNDILKKLGQD